MYSKSTSALTLTCKQTLPDLSHLSESERQIIASVLERQRAEEFNADTNVDNKFNRNLFIRNLDESEFDQINSVKQSQATTSIKYSTLPHQTKNNTPTTTNQLHQCHSISDIANEAKQRYGSIDTGYLCDICKKTKFTYSGAGHICFNCKLRCCVRCAFKYTTKTKQIWTCIECKNKQDTLLKSGKWLNESNNLNRKTFTSDYILNRTDKPNQTMTSTDNTAINQQQKQSRRVLPTITKQKTVNNPDDDDDESTRIAQFINNESTRSSISDTKKLRQPLLKQASLNNPPTYSSQRNNQDDYKNSNNLKSNTSNLEIVNLNEQNLFNSSQNSSSTRKTPRERLQDPLQILKTLTSNPNSRLNSINNISALNEENKTDSDLFSKNIQQQYTPKRILPNSNAIQRSKQLLLHPADSLSSDPSDYQQSNQIEFKTNLEEMSRKQSKTKRNIRARKQPPIPVNSLPQQQLLQKALMKHNLKQHSLTSSDDDLIMNKHASDYLPHEEEEDNFNDDDIDEEIRSTTEMSTNDEMDLESGSVSINQNMKNRVGLKPTNNNNPVVLLNKSSFIPAKSVLNSSNELNHQSKSIDDYLVQNLKKEEILAAKMSKFLSPTNWQLSSDGKKMLGHLILKHDPNLVNSSSTSTVDSSIEFNASSSLGLKIVGGHASPLLINQLCAFVVKLRKDSIADTIGRLQLYDEVVKWNGKLLRGLTFDEVYSIITKTQQDNQVELIVERLIDDSDRMKIKSSLLNESTISNAELKISQQQQQVDQYLKLDSSNQTIGKIQLKIFHDSIERILYINVLNISLNHGNHNEQTTLETTNDIFNCYNSASKNEVDSIYCLLHLLLKKRNIDQFKKLSKVCNLDKTTRLFLINEAFTFETVNSIDLQQLNFELQVISYLTREPLGKLNIEYSEEMFDNQLLNLNMLPINSNKNLQQQHQQQQGQTTADNTPTSQNSRRRQLPQLPGPSSADKCAVETTDNRINKLELRPDKKTGSDSESLLTNQFINKQNEQSSINAKQLPQQPAQLQQTNKTRQLPKQYSDKSDYSAENDEYLFNNNKTNNVTFHQEQTTQRKQQPVVPIRSRLRDASQPINRFDDEQQLYGQQTNAQSLSNRRGVNNDNSNLNGDNQKHLTHTSLHRQQSPPTPQSPPAIKPTQRQLPQPVKQPMRQVNNNINNSSFLPQEWHDADVSTNQNNKKTDRLIEKSLLLDLKSKTSDLYASNNNNNNNTSLLSQSPDNSNTKIKSIQSPFQQNSLDYSSEYSTRTTNNLDSSQQPANTQGTTPRRAEKLFSARHLNQRLLGNNLNNPVNQSSNNRNGFEFDSDGSEHSQFSNGSKLSSTSVKSAQSELLKGANNLQQNRQKNQKLLNQDVNNNRLQQQQTNTTSNYHEPNYQQEPMNQKDLISNNINQLNQEIINNDWNANIDPEPIKDQKITQKTIDNIQQEPVVPVVNIKKPTTTTPTATTNQLIKSTNNMPVPSYLKSKDNPTFDFFNQFSTPVKQTSKNNSTMSLPGQSMQQATVNNIADVKETDGTLSDSALSNPNNPPEVAGNKKRRPSMAKALVILGLSKKSNSASNLTLGKRYGFARSEEIGVAPELRNLKLNAANASADQSGSDTNQPKPRLWSGALKLPHEVPYSDFIEGLGPGQKISRQALGLPCLGEVKMALFLEKQKLNIEIQQARNLKIKIGYRVMPISVYIKLYLFNGTSCVEKLKTTTKRRTLNPTFQETLKFETNYRGTILQITCWGDYGKLDRKVFMGVAQIVLDELNLSNSIIGWYKLYSVSSIVTDFSTLTPATDALCATESGYSLSSK